MKKGCSIYAQTEMISVRKDALQLDFNQKINCKTGFVCGIVLDVKMTKSTAKCPDDYEKKMDISRMNNILMRATNKSFDVTMKTTPIKHPHNLSMDIMAMNDMDNHMEIKNYDEITQHSKNFEDSDDENIKTVNTINEMINTINEMVDTIHGMCKTIELAEETQKVTNEPSDDACGMATMNDTIATSYEMIEDMTKMFDATNKTTKDANEMSDKWPKAMMR